MSSKANINKEMLNLRVRNVYKDRVLERRVAELRETHERLASQSREHRRVRESNESLVLCCDVGRKDLADIRQDCEVT